MASAKVETWKKTAATAVDGLVKEFESVAKELEELDKKRKAIKDALEKAAGDVTKKIKLEGFDEADKAEVEKFHDAIFDTVRKKNGAFKGQFEVHPNGSSGKTILTNFFIKWSN